MPRASFLAWAPMLPMIATSHKAGIQPTLATGWLHRVRAGGVCRLRRVQVMEGLEQTKAAILPELLRGTVEYFPFRQIRVLLQGW